VVFKVMDVRNVILCALVRWYHCFAGNCYLCLHNRWCWRQ